MDVSKTQLIESVFAGGGEMGARMRAVDWATTVLGPVEQWPQSLRGCVRIVLGSGHPMLISWPGLHEALQRRLRGGCRNKAPWGIGSQLPRGACRGVGFHHRGLTRSLQRVS